MDDAQGTIRAAEPDRYTIGFGADGTASMRLDCNRGRSSFEAESTGPGQGSPVFGQIMALMADGGLLVWERAEIGEP